MRDIGICRKCRYYVEDIGTLLKDSTAKPDEVSSTIRQTHWCMLKHDRFHEDVFSHYLDVEFGHVKVLEFYRMENDRDCPYYAEHMIYEMNTEEREVDYGVMSVFRRTRTCQHCGREIPNRKKCPHCGYSWFKCKRNPVAMFARSDEEILREERKRNIVIGIEMAIIFGMFFYWLAFEIAKMFMD